MANIMMEIGKSALFASQAAIQTTGNNIANVNTPGYTRQYVRLEDQNALDYKPGRIGLGVHAAEVLRYFDTFLEKSCVSQNTSYKRWDMDATLMRSVENIFNEANRSGVSSQVNAFFLTWQDLSLRPNDMATREELVSQSDSLTQLIRSSHDALEFIQEEMNNAIRTDVDRANDLIEAIYDLGLQIRQHTMKGVNNPNDLLDKRDQLVRELSCIIDLDIQDREGEYYVRTKGGQPLIDDVKGYFALEVQGPKAETHLAQLESNPALLSEYTGKVNFTGSDAYEYTLEIVQGGNAGGAPPPQFRVSLDGGKSWLKNDDGTDLLYEIPGNNPLAPGETYEITVKNLKISFEDPANLNANFNAGDKFTIIPKSGVYFVAPTKGSVEGLPAWGTYPYTGPYNITPQAYFDGTENQNRIVGGSLAAYFNIRDNICGSYLDRLDAFSESLIWEVNRLHSQGTGLIKHSSLLAEYGTDLINVPMNRAHSGLDFFDRLTEGNLSFHIYDERTGEHVGSNNLDFSFVNPPGSINFDPAVHTIENVRDAINNLGVTASDGTVYANVFDAQIISGKLQITMNNSSGNPPFNFATGADTTGILAALGLNTFFSGVDAGNIAVDADLRNDPRLIASGKVNGAAEVNSGDNDTAKAIAQLLTQKIEISTMWQKSHNQSLSEYYNSFVGRVGADTAASQNNAAYNKVLFSDLDTRQAAVAGVNLDEEMSNLIKFQHSYTAAAKLITTADQMMQTILGLKL